MILFFHNISLLVLLIIFFIFLDLSKFNPCPLSIKTNVFYGLQNYALLLIIVQVRQTYRMLKIHPTDNM